MDSLVFLLGKAQHTQESPRWKPSTQKHPTIHWRSTLKSPNSSTSCSGHHSYNKNCDAFMLDWYKQNVVRSAVAASSPDSVLSVPEMWRSVLVVEGRHWLGSIHPVNSNFHRQYPILSIPWIQIFKSGDSGQTLTFFDKMLRVFSCDASFFFSR